MAEPSETVEIGRLHYKYTPQPCSSPLQFAIAGSSQNIGALDREKGHHLKSVWLLVCHYASVDEWEWWC